MKRIFVAAAIIALCIGSAFAQQTPGGTGATGSSSAGAGMLPQVGVSPVPIVINQPPAAKVSFGSIGGDLLNWLALVFGAPVALFLTTWLRALAKKAGIEVSQAASEKLDAIIERGINVGAAKAGADLAGKLDVNVQNKVIATAIEYAKAHGKDTISDLAATRSSLGFLKALDPNDPKVQEALAARATVALNKIAPDTVIDKPTVVVVAGTAAGADASAAAVLAPPAAPAAAVFPATK